MCVLDPRDDQGLRGIFHSLTSRNGRGAVQSARRGRRAARCATPVTLAMSRPAMNVHGPWERKMRIHARAGGG